MCDKDVVEKIKKLLALSQSNNEQEAEIYAWPLVIKELQKT